MKILLFALLLSLASVQKSEVERVQLTKITDLEEIKKNIKRVAPPFVNFEPCGEYFVIASQNDSSKRKMIYWQGKDANGKDVVKYAAFDWLEVNIDNSLKAPEVVVRAVAPPQPVFIYRMSQKDYKKSPCLPLNK